MNINYTALAPEMVLSLAGILIMLLTPYLRHNREYILACLALSGIAAAALIILIQWNQTGFAFFDMVHQDRFGHFSRLLFLLISAAIAGISVSYLRSEKLPSGEFYALLLFGAVGMGLMVVSVDLILTFLGLEVLAISTYVLTGFKEGERRSTEAAIKYFLLGAFSTAFLLYGIALVYGVTGSTHYLKISEALLEPQRPSAVLLLGLGLMVVGFGFKATLAPFHVWTPDVYQGAPLPVTTYLAVGSKAAALLVFLKILYQVLPQLSGQWRAILWFSAVLTMMVGNLAALAQTNIKRVLAYSSIAHAGYLLVGLTAHNRLAVQSVLFYLVAYAFMTMGAFAVVQVFGRQNERHLEIADYAGAAYRHSFLSVTLSIFLISLAGIPATAGFMGKFLLFAAALQRQLYWLVLFALVASAMGLYYYLRIIVVMFMQDPADQGKGLATPLPVAIVIALMAAGTLYLGILPGFFLRLAGEAVNF